MNINIAGYHFAHLSDLALIRQTLLDCALAAQLKGTILLSTEGINLFVSGTRDNIDSLLSTIRGYPELADLIVKESLSDNQPFNRMLVKIKKEILSFGIEGASPLYQKPRYLAAKQLKEWLDLGKNIILLDTRNDFEVEIGTFEHAEHLNIKSFKKFIDAVAAKKPEWESKTIVTFCTGGIRCEKAAPFMEMIGFKDVWQLEGGILKYFEECGGEHYDGTCFVFDKRVALKPDLSPSGHAMCYDCQSVLNHEGASCSHCSPAPLNV